MAHWSNFSLPLMSSFEKALIWSSPSLWPWNLESVLSILQHLVQSHDLRLQSAQLPHLSALSRPFRGISRTPKVRHGMPWHAMACQSSQKTTQCSSGADS